MADGGVHLPVGRATALHAPATGRGIGAGDGIRDAVMDHGRPTLVPRTVGERVDAKLISTSPIVVSMGRSADRGARRSQLLAGRAPCTVVLLRTCRAVRRTQSPRADRDGTSPR